jgi:3-dehydroquinate dehydratase-2
VVANGPNLNLLGTREPEIYGTQTLADLEREVTAAAAELGCETVFFQSNHEGEMVDRLHAEASSAGGIVINPAALTHYSIALYDCLKALPVPAVEVHISNLFARAEPFRTTSVTARACVGIISGLGFRGYRLAMEYLLDLDK